MTSSKTPGNQDKPPEARDAPRKKTKDPKSVSAGKKTTRTRRSQSAVPQGVLGRAGRLGFGAFKGSMRLAMIGPRTLLGKDSPQKLLADLHATTAQELVETLGRLKGASMKVGQLASFIDAGVLPPEIRDTYQAVLGSLRDAAPPMKPQLVHQVFRREFDAEPKDLFAEFEEKPTAAASLGQVHLAVLKDGRKVAVKIQYPGIESAIKSDLAMTAAVRPLMPLLAPGLEAEEALAEIRQRVLEECDYRLEAKNLDTLADHYKEHPFAWVPRSIPEHSTGRVLTMERAEGSPFAKIKKLPKAQRDRVGEIIFRFYYGSLHQYGFTSADPHPGNYFLMEDGRMAFFDFGLACQMDPAITPHMLGGLIALRDGDVDGFFHHAVAMRYVTRPNETDAKRFFEWCRLSLAPICEDRDYSFKREFIAERTAAMLDPRNPWWNFIRKLNLPRWAILQYRLELGLFAVLAQLGATGNWHRMTMEFYGSCEPSTDLGQQEWGWLESPRSP